ncbi:MAG TPA: hypothetical protein P5548_00460 [Candidatus Moranbacteria bacterium]|nr:hypothetical protein [Candidatus Moranbacteria bacterium]HRZ33364.1 hypothetical protein [Candidatus Moranbacteria bacterium]
MNKKDFRDFKWAFSVAFGLFSLYLMYFGFKAICYTYMEEKWQGYLLSSPPYVAWLMFFIFALLAILLWPRQGNYKLKKSKEVAKK